MIHVFIDTWSSENTADTATERSCPSDVIGLFENVMSCVSDRDGHKLGTDHVLRRWHVADVLI